MKAVVEQRQLCMMPSDGVFVCRDPLHWMFIFMPLSILPIIFAFALPF